jgi:hypothetical protein
MSLEPATWRSKRVTSNLRATGGEYHGLNCGAAWGTSGTNLSRCSYASFDTTEVIPLSSSPGRAHIFPVFSSVKPSSLAVFFLERKTED